MKLRTDVPKITPRPTTTVDSSPSKAPQTTTTTSTASIAATTSTAPTFEPAKSQALRAAMFGTDAIKPKPLEQQTMASQQAVRGVNLLGTASKALSSLSTGMKAAMIGLALFSTPLASFADTVFLDHNNAPKEVAVARELARSKGEPFVLVRPDKASLDSLFAKAERGDVDMRHLILSGHSSGQRVWGEGADGTRHESGIDDFKELKAKYPKAFNQVQHITFMSCYAGSAGNSAQWAGVFEKARVIAGFYGSGPSKDQPAAHQMLKNTELMARTIDKKPTLSPQQALLTAKSMANQPGSNVTLFAVRVDGVHHALGQKVTPLDQAQDRVNLLQAQAYEPFFNATAGHERTPTNHARSPLRDYYNALHAYGNALPSDSWQANDVSTKVEQTIRLIYFDVIVGKFQQTHQGTIDAARAEAVANPNLGVSIPQDLTKLSRAEILKLTDTLSSSNDVNSHINLQSLRDLLRDGLKNLDPSVIPSTWIG